MAPVSFREALRVWMKIGLLGFGGPAGQIALMHRELVERRRWIGEARFLRALNFCMVLPGPEAQQLAVYVGWLLHGQRGGLVAGTLFVLPGVLVLGVLSWVYVRFGALPWVSALFMGLKAAILAVVLEALLRIGKRALKTPFLAGVAIAAFVAIFVLQVPFPLIVLGAALAGALFGRTQASAPDAAPPQARPAHARTLRVVLVGVVAWLVPVFALQAWLGREHVIAREGWFFAQTAVVTFGGAYAVLAYVAQRAVEDFGWLRPGEMIDGLALAETTPGPLILVLQVVGFVAAFRHPGGLDPMLAATLGAALTVWVTFVPSFVFVLAGAPYMEALQRRVRLQAALAGVTAAVVGVILNLALWFAWHTWFAGGVFHPAMAALSVLAMLALLVFRVGLGWVLLGSALAGLGLGAAGVGA